MKYALSFSAPKEGREKKTEKTNMICVTRHFVANTTTKKMGQMGEPKVLLTWKSISKLSRFGLMSFQLSF